MASHESVSAVQELREFLETYIDYGEKILRGLQKVASECQRRAGRCAAQQRSMKQALESLDQKAFTLAKKHKSELPHMRAAAGVLHATKVDARCTLRLEIEGPGVVGSEWSTTVDLLEGSEEVAALRYLLHLVLLKREGKLNKEKCSKKKTPKKATRKQRSKALNHKLSSTVQKLDSAKQQSHCSLETTKKLPSRESRVKSSSKMASSNYKVPTKRKSVSAREKTDVLKTKPKISATSKYCEDLEELFFNVSNDNDSFSPLLDDLDFGSPYLFDDDSQLLDDFLFEPPDVFYESDIDF